MQYTVTVQATEKTTFRFGEGHKKTEAQASEMAIKALTFGVEMSPDRLDGAIRSIQKVDSSFVYSESWTFDRTIEAGSEEEAIKITESKLRGGNKLTYVVSIKQ